MFHFHRIRFENTYTHLDAEFLKVEARKKSPYFPLWIFLQDSQQALTLHLDSALPGQVTARGVKLPGTASRIWSLSLFAAAGRRET